MRLPAEIKVVTLLIAGVALAFLVEGLLRWAIQGGVSVITPTVVVAAFELAVVGGMLARLRPARLVGVVVLTLATLLHLVILLSNGPWWARVISGVLAVGGGYAVILLNTASVRDFLGSPR
ncbi:MAG: hypothetical protein ACRDRN_04985 [Sciscionella sp.]